MFSVNYGRIIGLKEKVDMLELCREKIVFQVSISAILTIFQLKQVVSRDLTQLKSKESHKTPISGPKY